MTPIPYFNRAWRIAVETASGNRYDISSEQTESLRVMFSIDTYMLLAYWQASISIFNLSPSTDIKGIQNLNDFWKFNQPVVAGDLVSVSAGYADSFSPDKSLLYAGRVLQPIWTRDNVVDYKLTLRCVTGLMEDALKFASFSLKSGATAYDKLNQICDTCGIQQENIDSTARDAMTQLKYPRGQVVHSRPFDAIREIIKQYRLFAWVGPNGLNVRKFDATNPGDPKFVYSSSGVAQSGEKPYKPTLLGTPYQTQDGIVFRVLMDSSVRIGDIVQIAPGTLVNLAPIQIGSLPPVPSRNGLYVVAGLRHSGDTRGHGDDWYTEINALTLDFFADFLIAQKPK